MARFYLTAVNSRGSTVSAAGSSRGQDAHLRGWNVGVEVVASVDDDDRDVFTIYATRGSNDPSRKLIGTLRRRDDGALTVNGVPGTSHSIPWVL